MILTLDSSYHKLHKIEFKSESKAQPHVNQLRKIAFIYYSFS